MQPRFWRVPTVVVVAFLVLAMVMIAVGEGSGGAGGRGRGAFDQINFHLPTIRQFALDWPSVDLRDYLSATAPGYHLVLALACKLGLESVSELRVIGAGFTAGLLWIVAWLACRRSASVGDAAMGETRALLCTLPVLASMYVLVPGLWLQPDNAGWLGVVALVALTRGAFGEEVGRSSRLGVVRLGVCGVVLTALVFTRQSHIWAAALVWIGAWLGAAPIRRSGGAELFSELPRRAGAAGLALLMTLPAAAMVLWLRQLWGGLTPPAFQVQHGAGFNAATPALLLALIGVYSAFFVGWVGPRLMLMLRKTPVLVLGLGLGGAVLAILPETTYLREARSSGLWNVVWALESRGVIVAGRTSPLLVVLAAAGAVSTAAWLGMLRPAARWYVIVGLLAFTAAQTANSNAWQRYLEPMLLIGIGVIAAGVGRIASGSARLDRVFDMARTAGPAALALLGAVLTYTALTATELYEKPAPEVPRAAEILGVSGDVPVGSR